MQAARSSGERRRLALSSEPPGDATSFSWSLLDADCPQIEGEHLLRFVLQAHGSARNRKLKSKALDHAEVQGGRVILRRSGRDEFLVLGAREQIHDARLIAVVDAGESFLERGKLQAQVVGENHLGQR